jgi:hypothetical protein
MTTANVNWTEHISNLSEADQQSTKQLLKELSYAIRLLQSRLQAYEAGEETALKTLVDSQMLHKTLEAVQKDLVKKHKLPGLPIIRIRSGPQPKGDPC